MFKQTIFFATLVTLSISSSAQETKATDLDPVTVTATLNPIQTSRTGRNVLVIKGDKFSTLPVHSIDELLRYLPGIEVQQRGPAGSQSDIVLRGGTFQQVLIILDGIRLNDPNTGHFNCYIPIAPAEIDRIEILKGASSAIYGSEAVGGVINIITKSFAAGKNKSVKQLTASGTIGEYSLINGNIGGFYQQNNAAISGGFLSNNTKGQLQRGTRGFFYNNTASLSFKQFIGSNWSIAVRSSYDSRDFSAQNFYTTFVSDTASEKVNTFWNQLKAQYQKGRHRVNIDAGYKAVKDHYAYNPSSVANENHSHLFQTIITDNYHLANQIHLITGAQYQRKWIRSNDRGEHDLSQGAAFLIWDQTLNKFSFSPSLRLDYMENSGTELVPQINLSYHLHQWQFRASAGKTIRQADFTERYNNYNKTFVSGGSIGNPDLQAERSFSYEAGADYFVRSTLKLSATFFRREQKNVIDWTPTPYSQMPRKDNLSPTGNYALASNVAKVNTSGLETDIQYSKKLKNQQQLWATLGVTWLDTETSETTPSFYISSHAKFLPNFNVEYSNKLFGLSVNGVYKHRDPRKATAINAEVDADCFMMNVMGELFILKKKLSVFTEVDNILDKTCGDLLGSQAPGRWIMGGIRLKAGN